MYADGSRTDPPLRALARSLAGLAGMLYLGMRPALSRGLTSFVFHDVGSSPSPFARENDLCVSPDQFRRQAAWVARNYNVVGLDRLLDGPPDESMLPERAALITFDDGWAGTFEHGLPILAELGLPSVVFLNGDAMAGEPFVAAAAMHLGRDPAFREFAAVEGLAPPFHLSLTPAALARFEAAHGTGWRSGLEEYQGALADWDTVHRWDGRDDVRFGNHLSNHWNAAALSQDELTAAFCRNEDRLSELKCARPVFAFPNGQPDTCFRPTDVDTIGTAGARRIFAATGRPSPDPQARLLDRIALTDVHRNGAMMWYAVSRWAFPPIEKLKYS